MKRCMLMTGLVVTSVLSFAQSVEQRLNNGVQGLLKDAQMNHAMMSLYVVETNTGKVLYNLNNQTGLAPASTQKLLTSVVAFELLGPDYKYKTEMGFDGEIRNGTLLGNLYLAGYGDPTFGSFRFAATRQDQVKKEIVRGLLDARIGSIEGNVILDQSRFSYQPLPGGWIWDDIGNYYGAGTWALNWNENQYDLSLRPGKTEGGVVSIVDTTMHLDLSSFINLLQTAKPGSGDNGYIYLPPYSSKAFVTGTEPAGQSKITISGSLPDPSHQIKIFLENIFTENNIRFNGSTVVLDESRRADSCTLRPAKTITTIYSPSLDSIIYWFLQKSINLYGEALIKTMAYEQTGLGTTQRGVEVLKNFWSERGIEKPAMNIIDGSGLSPQNRITTDALVKALQYARTKPWFNSFYNALPTYNGMKMKSGTIGGAKAFAGYQTSRSGTTYTFAIIINNFDDTKGNIVQKMYSILNELK